MLNSKFMKIAYTMRCIHAITIHTQSFPMSSYRSAHVRIYNMCLFFYFK